MLAKHAWPGLLSYSLDTVAEHCGYEFSHHDAEEDAAACAEVALHAIRNMGQPTLEDALESLSIRPGVLRPDGYESWQLLNTNTRVRNICSETDTFDESLPFYGRCVVFTGALDSMSRAEAQQAVVNVGAICSESVGMKTHFLVVGEQNLRKLKGGEKSSKMRRAESLLTEGCEIEVIGEWEFVRILRS